VRKSNLSDIRSNKDKRRNTWLRSDSTYGVHQGAQRAATHAHTLRQRNAVPISALTVAEPLYDEIASEFATRNSSDVLVNSNAGS
jgi:hypothetical protein